MKEERDEEEGDKKKCVSCFFSLQSYRSHRGCVLSMRVQSPWASNENIMNFQSDTFYVFEGKGICFCYQPSRYKVALQSFNKLILIEFNLHKSNMVTIEEKYGKCLCRGFLIALFNL